MTAVAAAASWVAVVGEAAAPGAGAAVAALRKDVQSQRLTVRRHLAVLSTKKENKRSKVGLESMIRIIDPSPLPILDRQSKMLPGWVWGYLKGY